MKASTVRIKVFQAATAELLEAAHEAWRAAQYQSEIKWISSAMSNSGTDLVLTVFYTQ